MFTSKKPFLSSNLSDALKAMKPYAKRGYTNAEKAINLIESTVATASEELQNEIDRLEYCNIRDKEVSQSLRDQLQKIQSEYSTLPAKLREKMGQLSRADFTITVFGRTMAGKSTLMETLTHGDGKTIGCGAQRTTRNVRRYKYKRLQFVDVPGIAADGGMDDEETAFNAAEESDLILFLLKDTDVQPSVAECLDRVISKGKPVVCLINVHAWEGSADMNAAKNEINSDTIEMLKFDLEDKYTEKHLEGIKRQLFEFGSSYGNNNWENIRFVYVHLKAAYLSQQEECAEYSQELYNLSHFRDVDRIIVEEVTRNGGFYKLKTYLELVSGPLVNSVQMLFGQSAQNSQQGTLMKKKKNSLSDWTHEFIRGADTQINTFITTVSSDLKKEVALFAENNYNNKNASQKWNEIVREKNIQERAAGIVQQLADECENELREITRETEYDLNFFYKFNAGRSLNMPALIDGRRIWNWATAIVSGGLTIAGLFVAAVPLTIAGIGVGLMSLLGKLFFADYESQAKKARKDLEQKLITQINKSMRDLRNAMKKVEHDELLKKYLWPVQATMDEMIASLYALSDVQHQFAKQLNSKLAEVNKLILLEALEYEGFSDPENHIEQVARIPGYAEMITLNDTRIFPDKARAALHELMNEEIWLISSKKNVKAMLCQALGLDIDQKDIRIQQINGEPRIAYIPELGQVDAQTKLRLTMVQQLTGLLIMN